MKQETDILIIGGGPAGSTTALYLSKLGYAITLIEKKKFPRETLCGEFLSKEVTDILKELNIFQEFISMKPNQLKSFRAINDSGTELHSDLNFEAYAMKRSVFDSLLLENAKKQNVNVTQPAIVKSVSKINSGFISEIENESGETVNIKSRLVVAAYGKQNPLDKKLERNFINKKSLLNGIKFHLPVELLKEKFPDEIRIYTNEGLYCGMNQVNESEITVCFLENRKITRIPSRERLAEVIGSNKSFRDIFSDEAIGYINSANVYGTGNIHFGKREVVENGIIMVGDSARVIAPLAGDGIGMAMESAKILYEVLIKYKLVESDIQKIYLDYKQRYDRVFSKRLKTARIIQGIILNKKLRKIGFTFADKYPALLPYLIKFTRSGTSAQNS
ncbi:MAG: NAD(P)/FAD-dependent oxidoreductase [Ignavibacterium sp.]|nr:NAD(P)/FAD-dependent oxidoreductase [Ignavibacterium sp.]